MDLNFIDIRGIKMNTMLNEFLVEFGIDLDMFRILEREGYFPKHYIEKILEYYQDYLDGQLDFDEVVDVLMEEVDTMRQIFISGNSSDIYNMTHKGFINYFVNDDFLNVGIDTTGLTEKEICKKYIDEYYKTDNPDYEFMYDDKLIVIEEYNRQW